jgi:hypothetical protein
VVAVVAIDVRVERAGVDDQRDEPASLARISSMRSEMSVRPLAPAPAARRRRLPRGAPSSASIASRVSSDTVTPRRSASWRNRASRSSGSLTVVRRTYASIPTGARPRGAATSLVLMESRDQATGDRLDPAADDVIGDGDATPPDSQSGKADEVHPDDRGRCQHLRVDHDPQDHATSGRPTSAALGAQGGQLLGGDPRGLALRRQMIDSMVDAGVVTEASGWHDPIPARSPNDDVPLG